MRCTRRIEFDAAHRVVRHESKCAHLHGHRYVVDIQCEAQELDSVGRVVDFSVVKAVVGGWVDTHLDHGTLANGEDAGLIALCESSGWKVYKLPAGVNPTAEVLAAHLLEQANVLLAGLGVVACHVRVYETPNCWADAP